VILVADPQLHTLRDLQYHKRYKAGRGRHGEGALRHGRDGEDRIVPVPVGTVVKDYETGEILADLTEPGQQVVVARGGRGGWGNAHFATPTHRTPREWTPGEPGEERILHLELKVLADVGLVGFPNAGKSTLLAALSRARPQIAPYPFTTINPQLGIVKYGPYRSFVLAEIPGLIEGAAQGKGLGLRFLRHLERCRVLLFLISVESEDPAGRYAKLKNELRSYSPHFLELPRLVALTKIDIVARVPEVDLGEEVEIIPISAVARRGLDRLVNRLGALLESQGS